VAESPPASGLYFYDETGATTEPLFAALMRDYPLLRDDLRTLAPEHVVLIKANVSAPLEPRLMADGFRALNAGRSIYFPSHGRQGDFQRQFAEVAAAALVGK
jgi:hypothetical protein